MSNRNKGQGSNKQQPPVAEVKPVIPAVQNTGLQDDQQLGGDTQAGGTDTVTGGNDTVTGGETQTQGNDEVQDETADTLLPTQPPADDGVSGDEQQAPVPVVEEPAVHPLYAHLKARFPKVVELPAIVETLRQTLDTYVETMGKNVQVTKDSILVQQGRLNYAMQTAVGAKNGDHRLAIETVLFYFHSQSKSAFEERLVWRCASEMKLFPAQKAVYQNLLTLFIATADPTKRKSGLRGTNINRVADSLSNPDYRQNLLDFYLN